MLAVAPGIAVNVTPPLVLACHWTVGVGIPLTEVVNVTILLTQRVWLAGFALIAGAVLTVSVTTADVLGLNSESPLYCAEMECRPAASVAVEKLACPEASSVSVSITVAPSTKVTVPVGVSAPDGLLVTTAVNVTGWPMQETFVVTLKVVTLSVV